MKRLLSSLLLTLYLLSSVGLTLRAHYCGGDLASLAIFDEASCCCDEDEPVKDNDCCKDEVKTIKISNEQRKVETENKVVIEADVAAITSTSFFTFFNSDIERYSSDVALPADPIENNKPPAYYLYHSLLFYS